MLLRHVLKTVMALRTVFFVGFLLLFSACQKATNAQLDVVRDDAITLTFRNLDKSSEWQLVATVNMDFVTFHTQGLVKIGDVFYVSTVEIIEKTETYANSDNLWDFSLTRTPGKGRGWLFKFDGAGKLLGKIQLTAPDANPDAFHPGGIDYDGQAIWVPVAEYRPNSATDVYRVDPQTMQATLAFRIKDHIGGIVHNTARDTFHGVSWGARRLYQWTVAHDKGVIATEHWKPNPNHYIDYQDCQYSGVSYMLCGGLQKYDTPAGKIALGGIDLLDISDASVKLVHQLPISRYWDASEAQVGKKDATMIVSNNPFFATAVTRQTANSETTQALRIYFMPDKDNLARLFIYEIAPAKPAKQIQY